MVAAPPIPLLVPGPIAGTAAGKPLKNSSTATGWDDLISSAVIEPIGLVDVAPSACCGDYSDSVPLYA